MKVKNGPKLDIYDSVKLVIFFTIHMTKTSETALGFMNVDSTRLSTQLPSRDNGHFHNHNNNNYINKPAAALWLRNSHSKNVSVRSHSDYIHTYMYRTDEMLWTKLTTAVIATCSVHTNSITIHCLVNFLGFFDQELISYRYSSCCCCCSCWDNALQKKA